MLQTASVRSDLPVGTMPATDETTAGTATTAGTSNANPLPATDVTTAGAATTVGTSSADLGPTVYYMTYPQHIGATSSYKKSYSETITSEKYSKNLLLKSYSESYS